LHLANDLLVFGTHIARGSAARQALTGSIQSGAMQKWNSYFGMVLFAAVQTLVTEGDLG
jgi:hypothetical protein